MNTIWFVSADTYVILIVGSSHDTGNFYFIFFVVVVPCNPINCSTPGFLSSISWSLLKLMSIESMTFNHLVLCHPCLLLPSIFPSIRVFSSELVPCISWPKYWSFSFNISPSNEYSALISIGLISLQSKGLSRLFPNTTVQEHLFFGTQPSLWSNFHIHT